MAQTNQQLIAEYASQEAPLLPLLHAFHERDGYLSEEALRAASDGLKIPIAELFGTVTFYHHFAREPGGHLAPRVCTGFICRMNGAEELLESLDGATGMPCSGRCDEPIPVLRGKQTLVGTSADALEPHDTPVPPPSADGVEECVFRAHP